jgi:ABC-2 type transport system ATP-binding protein
MDNAVELDHVRKQYRSQVALDDVSLTVPAGVVFALLGENGAGKTTAIRVLLGLTLADSGHAHVLGLDSRWQHLEVRRRIGYVAERPALYEWMTVEEIGWFAAGFYGPDPRPTFRYMDEYSSLIERYHLPPRKKISSLSKGMRSKVSLILALANDPDLLILDEPTSGLDPMVRREFLESMVDRAAQGKTVLLSSHQIHEVERVAEWVAVLHRGQLVLVARLEDLKNKTRELTVTMCDEHAELPELPAETLRRRQRDRQWQLLTGDMSEEAVHKLAGQDGVESVQSRVPSLEEIFVAHAGPEIARDNEKSIDAGGEA